MKNKDLVEKLQSAVFDYKIPDVSQGLLNNLLTVARIPLQLKEGVEKILNVSAAIEYQSDLEGKRQVYRNIAQFLQNKFHSDMATSLSAVYILCNESEKCLVGDNFPSNQAKQVAEDAKTLFITIKVHYERFKQSEICNCKTEIFYINTHNDQPTVTRIEEQILWENILSNVRETFITEGKDKLSYKLYP